MTTPSPTVIEEARKMAAAMYGADTVSASCVESGDWDETPIVRAFTAAIELGERRAAAAVVGQTAQIAAMTEALGRIKCGDVPRPVAKQYLPDKPSKHDRCAHGAWMYEDCGECVSDFIRTVLAPKDADQ